VNKTPIALFAYNRPSHVDRALASLSRCSRLDECRIYIHCDGPRKPENLEAVEAVRKVVRKWAGLLGAEVAEHAENRGLDPSIVSTVSELCSAYGSVIVLEDDLVVSPDFLDYMLEGLYRYRHVDRVYQISGYMAPVKTPAKPDALFLPFTNSWGWAVWERAWQAFDWDCPGYVDLLSDPVERKRFDLNGSFPFADLLRKCMQDPRGPWDLRYYYAVFRREALVLYPRQSLVWNGGFDGTGMHCLSTHYYKEPAVESFSSGRLSPSLSFPFRLECDRQSNRNVQLLMHCVTHPRLGVLTRLRQAWWRINARVRSKRNAGGSLRQE